MAGVTLILCSSMPEAQAYYREAKQRGEKTVACSSVHSDETAGLYDTWEWLPSVYDRDFLTALTTMAERYNATGIYCPHDVVYTHLAQLREEGQFNIPLLGDMVMHQRVREMERLTGQAIEAQAWMRLVADAPPPPVFRVAAWLRQAEYTFGESSLSKMMAVAALFPGLPAGDIVEIGSYWGKMATMLAMLARDYEKGAVLCADPWKDEPCVQKDSPELLQKMPHIYDWEMIFTGFTIHAAAVATPGTFNYLRMPSAEAAVLYSTQRNISSMEFGQTAYAGKISLIHIDGNHDYASVKLDYESWRPKVAPGGWIVLDDYVWHHGDGPKRLGDEVLAAERKNISRSFVAGKALFLQVG